MMFVEIVYRGTGEKMLIIIFLEIFRSKSIQWLSV